MLYHMSKMSTGAKAKKVREVPKSKAFLRVDFLFPKGVTIHDGVVPTQTSPQKQERTHNFICF